MASGTVPIEQVPAPLPRVQRYGKFSTVPKDLDLEIAEGTCSQGHRPHCSVSMAASTSEVVDASSTLGADRASESNLHLGAKIKAFAAERVEDRKRKFEAVVWVFKRVMLAGVIVDVGGIVCGQWLGNHVSGALVAVGLGLITCGLVIGCACPPDLVDANVVCEKMPKTTCGTWLTLAFLALMQVRYFPHLDAVKVLINLGAATCGWRRLLPTWWPLWTTFASLYMVFDPISWGFIFLFHDRSDVLQMQEMPSYAISGFNLLSGMLSFGIWLRRQWQMKRGTNSEGVGPTAASFEAFYRWAGIVGVRFIGWGAAWITLPRPGSADVVGGAIELAKGICIFAPVALAVALGRYRLFHILGKHFDRDGARRRRDGAFVAELSESVQVRVGQAWCVHRDAPDDRYQNASDPRRNWQEGKVVEVIHAAGEFVVELTPPGAPRVRLSLPSNGEVTSTEDFLLRVQSELRCVDFHKMTADLMARVDARKNPALQAEWFALSRPVREGERIDFFLSNSWYDNPELKWEKLVQVADKFHKRHGRYPTFWLDKLCIEQSAITDGLRCLPVNVMACDKLLALCGHTYLARLWCIWELFTLFAFMDEDAAMERVEFVFLADHEGGLKMLDSMASFHVKNSHCYDPNEEARLLEVIRAVGTSYFNKRISNMARKTRIRLDKASSKIFMDRVRRVISKASSGKASFGTTSSQTDSIA